MADQDNNKQEKEEYISCYESVMVSKVTHFYLSEVIGEPVKYIDMIHRIKMAGPEDIIYIYLNTQGGHVNTGVQIINAMQVSQAHIITVLEGEVASLGTLIFLSGDEFIVHDNCLFMIHNFSGGTQGKGHEQAAAVHGTIKWFTKLARRIYIPFLTEDELDRIIRGEDFWMDSDDVRNRLTKMVKILHKENVAKEKAERIAKTQLVRKTAI